MLVLCQQRNCLFCLVIIFYRKLLTNQHEFAILCLTIKVRFDSESERLTSSTRSSFPYVSKVSLMTEKLMQSKVKAGIYTISRTGTEISSKSERIC
jgi:hypothetical protein